MGRDQLLRGDDSGRGRLVSSSSTTYSEYFWVLRCRCIISSSIVRFVADKFFMLSRQENELEERGGKPGQRPGTTCAYLYHMNRTK